MMRDGSKAALIDASSETGLYPRSLGAYRIR